MTDKLSTTLWSAGGLLATLFIAWYFSKRQSNAETETPVTSAQASTPGSYNYTLPGITVPEIPTPVIPSGNNSTTKSSCCKNCASDNQLSGGKVISSGDFFAKTFHATAAVAQKTTSASSTNSSTGVPVGPELIPQQNGGLPLPSLSWWENDVLYRQAYVMAYNQTLGQLRTMLNAQGRNGQTMHSSGLRGCPPFNTMPMTFAENDTPDAAINLATSDGDRQMQCSGTNGKQIALSQSNSILFNQQMGLILKQWLNKLGDQNVGGGSSFQLPADQPVFTIQ